MAIIISASGMCEAGRILHHLKNNNGDPKTTVLCVGYSELLDYFGRIAGAKQRVWLVHGEPDSATNLRKGLMTVHSGSIEVAELGWEVEF